MLALSNNGDLQSWQGLVVNPGGGTLCLFSNLVWGILKRLEACNENMSQQEKAIVTIVVYFTKATQDARSNELA
jgi:hypothetical protein